MTEKEPRIGELVYGCYHLTHCGRVLKVLEHITKDGLDHYIIQEDWEDRQVRVRREPNGLLYEVDLCLRNRDL